MNINLLFILIISGLLSIFFFFQPEKMTYKEFNDVPLLHIKNFTMYELNPAGVKTLMYGKEAYRYEDRYTIDNFNHIDNSNYVTNLKADFGIYKEDVLTLDGNVSLSRNDGLSYSTQKASYNKKTALFVTDTKYEVREGKSILHGSYLDHNNLTGKIHAKNIKATYYFKEVE